MPISSTLLSAIILAVAIMGVVAYAYTLQNIRYMFLVQMENRIERTKEVLSVGAWVSGPTAVVGIKNAGSVGVYIKSVVITVSYTYVMNNQRYLGSYVKNYTDIYLQPFRTKYILFDVSRDINDPRISYINISYFTTLILTEKNSFIFDSSTPLDAAVVRIRRDDIGKTLYVGLPNGKTAVLAPYEFLLCGVGSASRLNSQISPIEAVNVTVALSPTDIRSSFYNYGYDYTSKSFTSISISTSTNIVSGQPGVGTSCTVNSQISMSNPFILSRGLIVIATQLSIYDVVAVTFASSQYPIVNRITPSTSTSTNIYITKVPLPSNDISIYDFLGVQVAPYILGAPNKQAAYSVGNFYSQAILVGQSITGFVSGNNLQIDATFYEPYPIVIIIAPPPVEIIT